MKINDRMLKYIRGNHGIITTSQAERLGFSRALLSIYAKRGLLERGERGIYILPDSVHDDLYILMLRSKEIVFSHETALFLNQLSDRTPFEHSVTIPSNTKLSEKLENQCICYYIKPELHHLGMIKLKTTFGNVVRCYNAERTICDILRSRNKLDEDTVIGAVKNYALSEKKDLSLLSQYAELLGVGKIMKLYMGVLL